MAEEKMPKMGDAMEEGTIVRWLKKEGEVVQEEEAIAEIQTEKANVEIVAYSSGVLTRILIPEGQTVPVGTPIAIIGGNGDAPPAAPPAETAAAAAPEPAPASPPDAPAEPEAPAPRRPARRPPLELRSEPVPERVRASPLARKLAAGYGLDLAQIHGSGPAGRIVEADVEEFRQRAPAPAPRMDAGDAPDSIVLSPMRKAIARRLTESKQTIPHFYLTGDVNAAPMVGLRSQLNAAREPELKLSFNDFVVKACAVALTRHPSVNSRLAGDRIERFRTVNIGVAVSLAEGLVVPVVRGCEMLSLTDLSRAVREKASRARAGKLAPDETSGGTFTVSNLGMYDVEEFAAVINPPEAAILAVGAIRDAAVVEEGRLAAGQRMKLTLSVDHRIVDGAAAAGFLHELKGLLEKPLGLLE